MSQKPIDILSKYMGPLANMRKAQLDGKCPFCGTVVSVEDFRDDLSVREWEISGLCQSCQDETFREPEDDS